MGIGTLKFETDLAGQLFNGELSVELQCNSCWIDADECSRRGLNLELVEERKNADCFHSIRVTVSHRGNETFRLGGIRFVSTPEAGKQTSGRSLRLYLEGWSMPSPCGMRRYGDYDFQYNPEYLPVAVAEPAEYDGIHPNHFRAEHALGIQDDHTGRCALIGFLTTADQYGRFQAELREDGLRLNVTAGFDDRLFEPGDSVRSEEIAFFAGDNIEKLLTRYAALWGERMNARHTDEVPTGWCSWYYYFSNVTEKDILENLEFLADHRELPLKYLQLDDGYQPACGDWLLPGAGFPGGPGSWTQEARRKGFLPALWVAPFLVEQKSELFRRHPEWCIRNAEGDVLFPMRWRGNSPTAILDGTNPEVQRYFRKLFAELRRLGFAYVKLDFLVYASAVRDGMLHDRKATRAQAFRRGLEAIREGFGDDGFLLGCTAPFGPCVGVVDGERIATDITPYWSDETRHNFDEAPTLPNVCRNGILHAYMHRKLYLNDPDTHIARTDNNRLTEDEVKLWTAALKINGGMLLLSDRFQSLTPERRAYSELLLAEPDAYVAEPLDRMERTVPALWHGVHRKNGSEIFGIFNFEDVPLQLSSVPWPEGAEVRDLFTGKTLSGSPKELAPHSCIAVTLS